MLIYISRELVGLQNQLKNMGYDITNYENDNCDVIICDLKNKGFESKKFKENLRTKDILVIDSACRDGEEIQRIINDRTYGTIFR